MAKLDAVEYEAFETIKQTDENGVEFWFARDLQKVLQYAKWENFSKVLTPKIKYDRIKENVVSFWKLIQRRIVYSLKESIL